MQTIAQGELYAYTHGKHTQTFARIPVVVPCMGRRIVLLDRVSIKGENGTESDGGTEGTPST